MQIHVPTAELETFESCPNILCGPLIETFNDWFGSGRLACLAIGFVWLKNDNC